MAIHAVAEGAAPGSLVRVLYEVADDCDLPAVARPEDGGTGWRMRARHRLHEPETAVGRASDEDVVALLRACCSARDRLIVLLMARPGLRRGEVLGLRRGDVHLLADSGALSCPVARAHLHVVRRQDNPNRAVAKSRRQRAVPLGFLTVQAFDSYELERMTVPAAASSDFVFVNLFRAPLGVPMRLERGQQPGRGRGPEGRDRRGAAASDASRVRLERLDRGGPEGDLMELNGWTSPQMLRRYGASARSCPRPPDLRPHHGRHRMRCRRSQGDFGALPGPART